MHDQMREKERTKKQNENQKTKKDKRKLNSYKQAVKSHAIRISEG